MAITSIKTGSSFTNLVKYNDFLGPNSAYIPSSYESIASATGSGTTSVTFSSIPSTYKHLQIRFAIQTAASGYTPQIQFNGDTANNYARHRLQGDGTTAAASGSASVISGSLTDTTLGTQITQPLVGIIDIGDYASSTKAKTFRCLSGVDTNGSGVINLISGLWTSTSAINSIYIFISGSTFSSTTSFALYGIKG